MFTAFLLSRLRNKRRQVESEGLTRGFAHALRVKYDYAFSDPEKATGCTAYFDGSIGQLDVLEAERLIKEGLLVKIVAKDISPIQAKDFADLGAVMNYICFEPSSNQIYFLTRDNIHSHAFLQNPSYGRVFDLKKAAEDARRILGSDGKSARGITTVYGYGNLTPGRKSDIISAGGNPVDLNSRNPYSSDIASFALD